MKRLLSSILALVMLVTLSGVRPFGPNSMTSYAKEARDGYILTPQTMEGTMVAPGSLFLLTSEETTTPQAIKENLSISPFADFTVNSSAEGFIIDPVSDLNRNSLYTFAIGDATWVYQTAAAFKITGTLPAHQSTSVPIDSGIEIGFSTTGVKMDDYFSIEPAVDGTFEVHGSTAVFVPKALEPETLYKVKLASGLPLSGSGQTLTEDYVFEFETAATDSGIYEEPIGYFSFNNLLSEFATGEVPMIPMNYYLYDSTTSEPIQASVYAYDDIDDFSDALIDYNSLPSWSYFALKDAFIKTDDLSKVMTFDQPLEFDYKYGQQYLKLPESINPGFYLVDCYWNDLHFQTFIEVTDLSFYMIQANGSNMVWVNDLATGTGAQATVIDYINGGQSKTNADGIAQMTPPETDSNYMLYQIQSGSKEAVSIASSFMPYRSSITQNEDLYWHYLQPDRLLYKPDDRVQFWGFVKPRYTQEIPETVTVTIDKGGWFYYDYIMPFNPDDMAIETQELEVANGFFEGTFDLPNLEPGSYRITVNVGDTIVTSNYISVENYVKPAYKISMTADKKAAFVSEPVEFSTLTTFYEGTPVANLLVNYNISGYEYKTGQEKSDVQGKAKITYVPQPIEGYQGLGYLYANASVSLPESGEIYGDTMVQVFYNDLDVAITASMEDGTGSLDAAVHQIDFSRINEGSAEDDNDYLGKAVANHKISGIIYKNVWKKREIGQYYDYINKVAVPQYEYYAEQTKLQDITLATGADGKGHLSIPFDRDENCYYTAALNTKDQAGRNMAFEVYFSENWYATSGESDTYALTGDKESFDLDEPMHLQMMHNEKEMASGHYLYVTAQNGIMDYKTSTKAYYDSTYSAAMIPNVEIMGVYFNGKTYVTASSFMPRLDIEKNRLVLEVESDLDVYNPQEIVTLSIHAKIFSEEKSALVGAPGVVLNIAVVDEAIFALGEQSIDTLSALYEWVGSGIYFTYASHRNDGYSGVMPLGTNRDAGMGGGMIAEEAAATTETSAGDKVSGTAAVRSEFKDTAYFDTLRLDSNGIGKYSFQLPDNLTSWRVTMAGISKDLNAGSDKKEIIVSLPYFISTNLNQTYLAGDQPYIGATAYGTSLLEGEKIHYTLQVKETGYTTSLDGLAYERVNLKMPTLKEGTYNLIINSSTDSGYADAIQQTIHVVKTYHETWQADYYMLKQGLTVATTDQGTTDLLLMDQGRGRLLPELYNLAYSIGNRVDQKYAARFATGLLKDDFKMDILPASEFNLNDYQNEDGGIGLLPYASSDLQTTVEVLMVAKDEIDALSVKSYLYKLLDDDTSDQSLVLLGLSLLEEPVLGRLDQMMGTKTLSVMDYMHLGLSYNALGDRYSAAAVYNTYVKDSIKTYENTARLESGKTEDENLALSAWAMVLAAGMDETTSELLYDYVSRQNSKELLVSLQKAAYIQTVIEGLTKETVTMSYTYDGKAYSKESSDYGPTTISIPSMKLSTFKVTGSTGDGALVAVYKDLLTEEVQNDLGLSLDRHYYNYETGLESAEFAQTDIVKVQIDWSAAETAIDGQYSVTDYVPSGLVPINNPYSMGLETGNIFWYREIQGQKVTFYVSADASEYHPLYYYARVITPGIYQGEAPLMQGVYVKESKFIGEKQSITITQ